MTSEKKTKWVNKTENKGKLKETILGVNWTNLKSESYKYDSLGRLINIIYESNQRIDTVDYSYITKNSKNGKTIIRYSESGENIVTLDSFVHIHDSIYHFKPKIYVLSEGELKTIKSRIWSMRYFDQNRKKYLTKKIFNPRITPITIFNKKGFPILTKIDDYKYETRFYYDKNDLLTQKSNFRNDKFEYSILFEYEK